MLSPIVADATPFAASEYVLLLPYDVKPVGNVPIVAIVMSSALCLPAIGEAPYQLGAYACVVD